MNKKFVFTYENPNVETLTAEFKSDSLIDKSYGELYPMDQESHEHIIRGFGLNLPYRDSLKLGSVVTTVYTDKEGNISIIMFDEGKAVKKPTLEAALKKFRKMEVSIGLLIVPRTSKGGYDFVKNTSSAWGRSYGLITINQLMTQKSASTIPVLLGRYANKGMGDPSESKQTVVIRVPSKGFPSIGKSGKLNAGDIYEILESKTKPAGNVEKEKGFDLLLDSFYDLLDIIQEGKNITANRWNTILDKHGVIDFIENMEEE